MRHYHLHLQQGAALLTDAEGRHFDSLGAAQAEAVRSVRAMIAADILEGVLDLEMRIIVADSSGAAVAVVSCDEAIGRRIRPS